MSFSPNAETIAVSVEHPESVEVWAWTGSTHIIRRLLIPHPMGIFVGTPQIKYSPDGRLLATLDFVRGIPDQATAVYIWDSAGGRDQATLGAPGNFPLEDVFGFSPDGQWLSLVSACCRSSETRTCCLQNKWLAGSVAHRLRRDHSDVPNTRGPRFPRGIGRYQARQGTLGRQ
jgi:WD40 repeat protein